MSQFISGNKPAPGLQCMQQRWQVQRLHVRKKTSVDNENSQALYFGAMENMSRAWFSSKKETVATTKLDSTLFLLPEM